MLERTSSCVEPASHLFLRRLEPPIRSFRALGSSFWKNEGDTLTVPPWWPAYLKSVGSVPQSRIYLDNGPTSRRTCWPKEQDERSHPIRRRILTRKPLSLARSSRTYTRTAKPHRKASTGPNPGPVGSDDSVCKPIPTEDTAPHIESSSSKDLYEQLANENISKKATGTEEKLRLILEGHDISGENAGVDKFDVAWALFNQLPDQQVYATGVFHFLSGSGSRKGQKAALGAFNLIPRRKRTSRDYESAVRVALKQENYRVALSINTEATTRKLNHGCSSFLLLHTSSHRLWRTAARVWITSFKPLTEADKVLSASSLFDPLLKEVDHHENMPSAIKNLGDMLLAKEPIIMSQAGTLLALGKELVYLLLKSGRLMSLITPKGLLGILDVFRDLRQINPYILVTSIQTLLKSAKRPDKGGLSTLVYRYLRSNFPDYKPLRSVYGSLLSIHHEEAAPAEVYMYFLHEFAQSHGLPDKMSYQRVLTALAEQGDVDGVQKVFIELCQTHSRPTDVAYYTPLMYVHARLADVEGTEREFRRLKEWGIQPTLYCWNILLYAHARSGDPCRAWDVFDQMKAEGVVPNVYTFVNLMGIHSNLGDTNAVLDIIDLAQKHDIKGSHEMMAGLIHSYCLNDQAETAERIAETTAQTHFEGEAVKPWNYLLRYYAFKGDTDSVLRLQRRMQALGVQPDDMTYSTLMTTLVVIGKTQEAVHILRTLSLSQKLAATSFHYAIALYGYAMEGNRDMANVIYQEMVERFPRIGASPRLAMLHLQGRRSLEGDQKPHFAADYLAEILHAITNEDRATNLPQPGFNRRRPIDALPAIYLEFLTKVLTVKGQIRQADTLLQRYESLAQSSYLDLDRNVKQSMELLTTRLMVSTIKMDWENVEAIWRQIIEQAIEHATPYSLAKRKQRRGDKVQDTLPAQPQSGMGVGVDFSQNGQGSSFGSIVPTSVPSNSPLHQPHPKILFSQRYILEAALTAYLRALDHQHRHHAAVQLVEMLEKVGFALTSKNWNFYLQVLTRSQDADHWILAFKLFEEKMLPNAPPWRLLRRGKWASPTELATGSDKLLKVFRRETIEKQNKSQLMPTYLTTVYLATVLIKSSQLEAGGDRSNKLKLLQASPGTFRLIQSLPYYKDRAQGVLLRNRRLGRDLPKRPRQPQRPDRSGVLGSKSPLDHIPITGLDGLTDALKGKASPSSENSDGETARVQDIQSAEQLEGQVTRSPIAVEMQQLLEDNVQLQKRVEREENRLLKTMELIRRDASHPRTISDMYFGHPAVSPDANLTRPSRSPKDGALFDIYDDRLEARAEARKRLRDERNSKWDELTQPPKRGSLNLRKIQALPPRTRSAISRAPRLKAVSGNFRHIVKSPTHLPERLIMIRQRKRMDQFFPTPKKEKIRGHDLDSTVNSESQSCQHRS
ncbi:uncharacterized protein Z518_06242 [Rhinocladiella mackenziei CBS 650.93]|uniref:Pentatricopeptide repeat protein n=1 Tax=Rhinocladiella mackenziei CBS 650.93 TaxID=1442369 RepID=A0A0D2J8E4_9EURO|nr:uncharacterized protein Z518_06242 [Rhinocladiella mackenziei CBS 650.93]KIX05370.1 hypothetical protein Z518_06242 [Rhinocladiella mackenziei CBS 650.93]